MIFFINFTEMLSKYLATTDDKQMKKMPDQIIKLGSEWLNELSPKK